MTSNSENWLDEGLKGFRKFFNEHSKKLFLVACKHLPQADAEDLVQDLFVDIWESRELIKIKTSWEAYLYTALKYKIFRFLDRQNVLNISLREELNDIAGEDKIISFEELYDLLDDSLNNLSPQCRSVIEKKYFENKKLKEIAEELNISSETVKTHLKRGMKSIRLHLKENLASFFFL